MYGRFCAGLELDRMSDVAKRYSGPHNFNCPPITDLTKSVLIRKLAQLDGVEKKNVSKKQAKLMEYSSAEEEGRPSAS